MSITRAHKNNIAHVVNRYAERGEFINTLYEEMQVLMVRYSERDAL